MSLDLNRAVEISSLMLGVGRASAVNAKKAKFLQSGLGLVELMVAMVIGIISVLVMMQMFAVSEEQKRTTISGSDSLTSGAIALATLQRDIQQSGWGISGGATIGCSIAGLIQGGGSLLLAPVSINPAGITRDANTDVLQVVSGAGNGAVEGALINAQPSANQYDVVGSLAFWNGTPNTEIVFAAPATRAATCSFSKTTVSSVARPGVNVGAGVAGMEGGRLFSLGVAPTVRLYAIRGGNLTMCDYMLRDCSADTSAMTADQVNSLWVPIAENIVSMRAVYLPAGNQTSPTCGWGQIPAVRIALVARSSQPEKNIDWPSHTQHVTGAVPTWTSSGAAAIALPSPDATWPTWQDFRYKVFESVIPLRNVIAGGGAAEC